MFDSTIQAPSQSHTYLATYVIPLSNHEKTAGAFYDKRKTWQRLGMVQPQPVSKPNSALIQLAKVASQVPGAGFEGHI